MSHGALAYAKTAIKTAPPRELEATLLLTAAAKLQAVLDSWDQNRGNLGEAATYNRQLWTILLDALIKDPNPLPTELRENLTRLGMFVLSETVGLMTNPTKNQAKAIIKVNRSLAAGLRGRA